MRLTSLHGASMNNVTTTLIALAMHELSSYNHDRLEDIAKLVIDGRITWKDAVLMVEPFDMQYFRQLYRELENAQD